MVGQECYKKNHISTFIILKLTIDYIMLYLQLFIKEISRKEEYLRQRLAKAAVWEEVCRLQGGLNVCQQLLALVEHTGKGSEHGF